MKDGLETILSSACSLYTTINDQKIDKFDANFDNFSKDITDLKVGQARWGEKVDGLSNRMDN